MMKKTYIAPLIKKENAECCTILAGSEIISNNGIGYGGIDNDGGKNPEVKEFLWDKTDDFNE